MKYISKLSLLLISVGLVLQLAGCGAAEVSSAKLYRQQRNYVKANELLEQALQKNPQDPEALALYIKNLYDLKQYEKIADRIDTAWFYAVDYRSDIDIIRHNTWVELYNGGVGTFEQNPASPEQQQAAIVLLRAAQQLKPDQPETYEALGMIYETAGDTVNAVNTFTEALNQMRSSHEQGTSMGLMIGMAPDAAERSVGGAPQRQLTVSIGGDDSALVYVYPGSQMYLYFERAERAPRNWQLSGWKFGVPEQAGLSPLRISTNIYKTVANYYYQRGLAQLEAKNTSGAEEQFDRALPLLLTVQRMDPQDPYVASVIPEIYQRTNRMDKAKAQYENMLQENPNKALYTSFGTFLLKTNDFPGAIAAYEKALGLDPAYEPALFNTAATYKNWAASEQKLKKPDYKQKLEKSTEYFERLTTLNSGEMNATANLIENYDLLGRKDKLAALMTKLEGMKSSPTAEQAEFWEHLGTLYAKNNKTKESAEAFQRADRLRSGK